MVAVNLSSFLFDQNSRFLRGIALSAKFPGRAMIALSLIVESLSEISTISLAERAIISMIALLASSQGNHFHDRPLVTKFPGKSGAVRKMVSRLRL